MIDTEAAELDIEAADLHADAPFRETPHEPSLDEALPQVTEVGSHAAAAKPTGTLHMIGNSHIDPVWLWHWQEGYGEVKATFRSALERMREYPDFRFSASSAAFYEWVEENEPDTFREIQQRVAEGRWGIVGGWWIEPDCNLPSGESFVRQALHGQRYYLRAFGRTTDVGYNPDGFGHAAGLPQILAKSGLPCYTFMRPQVHEKELPRLFRWRSGDGSEVLAFRIMFEYVSWRKELSAHVRRCLPELGKPNDDLMVFFGVGNHGGGPTRENIDSIHDLDADPALPRIVMSTPEDYFRAVADRAADAPEVTGDLQMHAAGCYSANSLVKRLNRRSENLLQAAEKWSAVAERVTGLPYDARLDRAWKDVLFNQFHDILAGSAIEPAYEDARDLYGEALTIAARALNGATQSVARHIRIDPAPDTWPIAVFNPHAWAASVDVELESGGLQPTDVLFDDEDRPIASQMVRSAATVNAWRRRLAFVADLPPLGYRLFRVRRFPEGADRPGLADAIGATDTTLDNGRLRMEIDPLSGTIKRLRDLRRGLDVFSGEAARPVAITDGSDTWGHGKTEWHDVAGLFEATAVRLVEHGPVKSTIRVESAYQNSTLVQELTMFRALDRIDVRVTVDWRERHTALKLRFPVAVARDSARATWEAAYDHLERPITGEEVPGQGWFDVSGTARAADGAVVAHGVAILNDGKYSSDVRATPSGPEMGLMVLRSPIYAHHEPYLPSRAGTYRYQDQGLQDFRYTILPHEGDWRSGDLVRRAAELNQAPISILESFHDGSLPGSASFLAVDTDTVAVTVLKRAEDTDDLIVRGWETTGASVEARITLPHWGQSFGTRFGPGEIKTFRVPSDPAAPVVEVDLLERPLADAGRARVCS